MWFSETAPAFSTGARQALVARALDEARRRYAPSPKRVLLLPPDKTRFHSGAGEITNWLYHLLGPGVQVDVIPTLGQHVPHTPEENRWMFGDIPEERILKHDWRRTITRLGEVPADFVRFVSDGRADWSIPLDLHPAVTGGYDLVINIGQVVPHEVLGFANHNKNYWIGLGGKETICASHMMAGTCGIENNLGQYLTPLRACFIHGERSTLSRVPHCYIQLVMGRDQEGRLATTGIYVGDDVETYVQAARHSRMSNITVFDRPLKKVVTVMDPREFNATWVANKAVYRTRMAMADGGELIIIAPGVERFGEQPEVDALIRKHGYRDAATITRLAQDPANADLRDIGHGTAHLMHGASEGRFRITYAPGRLGREEVEGVGCGWMDCGEALRRYRPETLRDGYNTVDGEEVYFISSPSLGLWAARDLYRDRMRANAGFLARLLEREPSWTWLRQMIAWAQDDLARI